MKKIFQFLTSGIIAAIGGLFAADISGSIFTENKRIC